MASQYFPDPPPSSQPTPLDYLIGGVQEECRIDSETYVQAEEDSEAQLLNTGGTMLNVDIHAKRRQDAILYWKKREEEAKIIKQSHQGIRRLQEQFIKHSDLQKLVSSSTAKHDVGNDIINLILKIINNKEYDHDDLLDKLRDRGMELQGARSKRLAEIEELLEDVMGDFTTTVCESNNAMKKLGITQVELANSKGQIMKLEMIQETTKQDYDHTFASMRIAQDETEATLKAREEDFEEIKIQLAQLKITLANETERADKAVAELATKKDQVIDAGIIKEKEELVKEKQRLEQDVDQVKDKLETGNIELQRWKNGDIKHPELLNAIRELQEAQEKISTLQLGNDRLTATRDDLATELETMKSSYSEIEEQTNTIIIDRNSRQNTIAKLGFELEEAISIRNRLSDTLQVERNERIQANEYLDSRNRELQTLKIDHDNVNIKLTTTLSQLDITTNELEKVRSQDKNSRNTAQAQIESSNLAKIAAENIAKNLQQEVVERGKLLESIMSSSQQITTFSSTANKRPRELLDMKAYEINGPALIEMMKEWSTRIQFNDLVLEKLGTIPLALRILNKAEAGKCPTLTELTSMLSNFETPSTDLFHAIAMLETTFEILTDNKSLDNLFILRGLEFFNDISYNTSFTLASRLRFRKLFQSWSHLTCHSVLETTLQDWLTEQYKNGKTTSLISRFPPGWTIHKATIIPNTKDELLVVDTKVTVFKSHYLTMEGCTKKLGVSHFFIRGYPEIGRELKMHLDNFSIQVEDIANAVPDITMADGDSGHC